jgi:hypothetical protein
MIYINDPLIELLAIKLYEHDHQDGMYPSVDGHRMNAWMKLCDEDRQIYRDMATGERGAYKEDG